MHPVIKFLSILIILLLYVNIGFCQYRKEKIYLSYCDEIKNCQYENLKTKWLKKDGLQFNLCGKAVLLFSNRADSDTLCKTDLDNFKITAIEEVNQKVKNFRLKTYGKKPSDKNDKLYQFYNKNDIFETYLIEIISEDKFVVYPVTWRNQDIIE